MYDFSDDQCRILKLLGKDLSAGNRSAILYSSDIKGIKDVERLLQEFVNDGLFVEFKALNGRSELSAEELKYIKKMYGENIIDLASSEGNGYLVFVSILFEGDWDCIARHIKAHERINRQNGVCYELKYDEHNGFLLRYYDYCGGYRKDVLKIYNDCASQVLIEECFKRPNKVIKLDDIKARRATSKNMSQIICELKLPKRIRGLFFRGTTCNSVLFVPKVTDRYAITYDEEAMEYLENAETL